MLAENTALGIPKYRIEAPNLMGFIESDYECEGEKRILLAPERD